MTENKQLPRFESGVRQPGLGKGVIRVGFARLEDLRTFQNKYKLPGRVAQKRSSESNLGGPCNTNRYILEIEATSSYKTGPAAKSNLNSPNRTKHFDPGLDFVSLRPQNQRLVRQAQLAGSDNPNKNYFGYPGMRERNMFEYLDSEPHLTNFQKVQTIHALSHIDNPDSLRHGLIIQAPIDLFAITEQTHIQNVELALIAHAGRITMIATKLTELLKTGGPDLPLMHDEFKLCFNAHFLKIRADQKEVETQSRAYGRILGALVATRLYAGQRYLKGYDLTWQAEVMTGILASWDRNMKLFSPLDRDYMNQKTPLLAEMFEQARSLVIADFERIARQGTGLDKAGLDNAPDTESDNSSETRYRSVRY